MSDRWFKSGGGQTSCKLLKGEHAAGGKDREKSKRGQWPATAMKTTFD